jgi:hypothetical protein
MTRVLDGPVRPHRMGEPLDADREAADVVADLDRLPAVAHALGHHQADRPQALPQRQAREVGRRRQVVIRPLLGTPVPGPRDAVPTGGYVGEVVVHLGDDVADDGLLQGPLVPLQRQHVVGLALHDLRGDRFLGPHRIDGDDGAADVHQPQELGNRRDLVRFLVAGHLAQRQAEVAGPDADRVQRPKALRPIVAAPGRLAVHRVNRLLDPRGRTRRRAQRLQPAREAGLEGAGLEGREYSAEDVFARDPVGEVEVLEQQVSLQRGPLGNRRRPAGARQHGHHGGDHDADQGVPQVDRRAGVVQRLEVAHDLIQAGPNAIPHRLSSESPSSGATEERSTHSAPGAQVPKLARLPRVRAGPARAMPGNGPALWRRVSSRRCSVAARWLPSRIRT